MLYVFDWDGTLMDSTAKIIRCMQIAIKGLGFPAKSHDEIKDIIGLSLPVAVSHLYPGIEDSDVELLRNSYIQNFKEADQQPCALFPGVLSTLEQLRSEGHYLAVATGKSRKGLSRVLANLSWQTYFDATRCADETESKPHPLMLSELLDEFGVHSDMAVMVGDTEYDLAMAAAVAMPSIAVSYGAHEVDRLLPHNPVLVIDQFQQLLSWQGKCKAAQSINS